MQVPVSFAPLFRALNDACARHKFLVADFLDVDSCVAAGFGVGVGVDVDADVGVDVGVGVDVDVGVVGVDVDSYSNFDGMDYCVDLIAWHSDQSQYLDYNC